MWKRLVDGRSGIVSLKNARPNKGFDQQQCQVAGLVPHGRAEEGGWDANEWLSGDVCSGALPAVIMG